MVGRRLRHALAGRRVDHAGDLNPEQGATTNHPERRIIGEMTGTPDDIDLTVGSYLFATWSSGAPHGFP